MARKRTSKFRAMFTSTAVAALLTLAPMANAADWERHAKVDPDATTLITNVSIFNGTDEALITGKDVVVRAT